MLTWGASVFFSLLLHELGHALVGLAWGSWVRVVMYPLGGVTDVHPALSRGRAIGADAAGPLASILVGILAACTRAQMGHSTWLTIAMWVNLGWGSVNLLPVLPFDGGRILLKAMGPERKGEALAISTSVAFASALTGLVVVRSWGLALVFGAAAACSWFDWLKQRRALVEAKLGTSECLHDAEALLAQGRYLEAIRAVADALKRARSPETYRKASEVLAWCHLGQNRPDRARETLIAAGPLHLLDAHCRAAVEEACGHDEVALSILTQASDCGPLTREATRQLVDLCARRGEFDRACRVADKERHTLGPSDSRAVLDAAIEAAAFRGAAQLAGSLFQDTALPSDGIAHAYALAKLGDKGSALKVLERLAPHANDVLPEPARARLDDLLADPTIAHNAHSFVPHCVSRTTQATTGADS